MAATQEAVTAGGQARAQSKLAARSAIPGQLRQQKKQERRGGLPARKVDVERVNLAVRQAQAEPGAVGDLARRIGRVSAAQVDQIVRQLSARSPAELLGAGGALEAGFRLAGLPVPAAPAGSSDELFILKFFCSFSNFRPFLQGTIQGSGDPVNLDPLGLLVMIIVFFVMQAGACEKLGASGKCTDECDCPCPDGEFCFAGQCVQTGLGDVCNYMKSDCPLGTMCIGGFCKCIPMKEGVSCIPGHPCECPVGMSCEEDEQGDTVCKCKKSCEPGGYWTECGACCGCAPPFVCENNKCDCPPPKVNEETPCGMGSICGCNKTGVKSACNVTLVEALAFKPSKWVPMPSDDELKQLIKSKQLCDSFTCIIDKNGNEMLKIGCGCGQPKPGKECVCNLDPSAPGCVW